MRFYPKRLWQCPLRRVVFPKIVFFNFWIVFRNGRLNIEPLLAFGFRTFRWKKYFSYGSAVVVFGLTFMIYSWQYYTLNYPSTCNITHQVKIAYINSNLFRYFDFLLGRICAFLTLKLQKSSDTIRTNCTFWNWNSFFKHSWFC